MSYENDKYKNASSKLRRIYIPLPGFGFFHKPSEVNNVDSRFVERERIMGTLKDWLSADNGNESGSYLITGYRGMGKSSFVGKAINEMVEEQGKNTDKKSFFYKHKALICFLLEVVPLLLSFTYLFLEKYDCCFIAQIAILLLLFTGCVAICWRYFHCFLLSKDKDRIKHIHEVRINLGSEVCDEREILALISNSIKNKFKQFVNSKLPLQEQIILARIGIWIIVGLLTIFIYSKGMNLINDPGYTFLNSLPEKGIFKSTMEFFNLLLVGIRNNYWLNVLLGGTLSLSIAFLMYKYLLKPFILIISVYIGKPIILPAKILARLSLLCDRIDSSVDEDNDPYGTFGTTAFNIALKRKRTKKYERASVREIELELIEIIDIINSHSIFWGRFIIVLDELDKINPKINYNETKGDVTMPEFSFDENGFHTNIPTHNKKENLLYLLGQLKFFTNSAKAKFVFISGRELYDAYLADVSDREFSVSSIFNGVINVDSFFTCDSKTKDITRMTEIYLCKHLIDKQTVVSKNKGRDEVRDNEIYNLQKYIKFLNEYQEGINQNEKNKVLAFLKQFVTYLTFMSNGAPKKLTTTFEKYVISDIEFRKRTGKKDNQEPDKEKPDNENLIVQLKELPDKREVQYYLAFGYYDQQKIGFIHYMVYPIFETIISPSSEYGDKLLVSSSFLIAHIYKLHNSGFSWRNLEYLPELIESNRTPELREYIHSLIGYLGQIHLSQITSGIYHYKFPMRLVEEISVFTKKSEEISAIFNFSLDDSRDVKQYYLGLLEYHNRKGDCSPVVLANLHHYLGDIHMAHDEYTEAITQFRLAADILFKYIRKSGGFEDDSVSSLVVRYTRAMLKLGLAYEKRHTMDSAYMVYSDLTSKLVLHRDIDESKLSLVYKTESRDPEEYWKGKRILFHKDENALKKNSTFDKACYPQQIEPEEQQRIKYWIYGEELIDNLCDFLTPGKSSLISKLSLYEDLRLIYLPILAKLFSVEKQHICGITKDNIKIAEAEFRYLFLITNSKDKYILSTDFYRKMGDILYYKNMKLNGPKNSFENMFASWGFDIKDSLFDFCYKYNIGKKDAEVIIKLFTDIDIIKKNHIFNTNKPEIVSLLNESSITKYLREIIDEKGITDTNGLICENAKKLLKKLIAKIPKVIKDREDSVIECCRKRAGGDEYTPCFACKYYSRSMAILQDNLLFSDKDNEKQDEKQDGKQNKKYIKSTRALKFFLAIRNDKLKTLRQNELTQAALTLDAMGNIMLSCSGEKDKIRFEFLEYMMSHFDNIDENYDFSSFEKSILYYLAAMEFHYKASNNKEGTQCMIKVLDLLSVYIRTNKIEYHSNEKMVCFSKVLSDLEEKYIVETIKKTFANRDFYGLVEINKFKRDLFGDETKGKVDLGLISIMPDVEELLLKYYEIRLRLYDNCSYLMNDDMLSKFYNSPSLTYLRCDSLTYNRVISLLFKVNLNKLLLQMIYKTNCFCREGFIEGKKDFALLDCLKEMGETIISEDKMKSIARINKILLNNPAEYGTYPETGYSILEFLISDTLLCLSYITDFLSPTVRTTLFTNSFCGGIYENLYYWNIRKETLLGYYEDKDTERKKQFLRFLDLKLEKHTQNILSNTYLAQMANKYYSNAIEMHTEGEIYQNFINSFYILDDDLQNNTSQFYIGLERYKINIGDIYKNKVDLGSRDYYKPLEYFQQYNDSVKK